MDMQDGRWEAGNEILWRQPACVEASYRMRIVAALPASSVASLAIAPWFASM